MAGEEDEVTLVDRVRWNTMILSRTDLTKEAKITALCLISHADRAGTAWISNATLAAETSCSGNGARIALRRLKTLGLLAIDERRLGNGGSLTNLYRMTLPRSPRTANPPASHAPGGSLHSMQPPGAHPVKPPLHLVQDPPAPGAPPPPAPGAPEPLKKGTDPGNRSRAPAPDVTERDERRGVSSSEFNLHGALYVEAYERAARGLSGNPHWSLGARQELSLLLANCCLNDARGDIEGWIERTVEGLHRFVESMPAERRQYGWDLQPKAARKWFNDKTPSKWSGKSSPPTNGTSAMRQGRAAKRPWDLPREGR